MLGSCSGERIRSHNFNLQSVQLHVTEEERRSDKWRKYFDKLFYWYILSGRQWHSTRFACLYRIHKDSWMQTESLDTFPVSIYTHLVTLCLCMFLLTYLALNCIWYKSERVCCIVEDMPWFTFYSKHSQLWDTSCKLRMFTVHYMWVKVEKCADWIKEHLYGTTSTIPALIPTVFNWEGSEIFNHHNFYMYLWILITFSLFGRACVQAARVITR